MGIGAQFLQWFFDLLRNFVLVGGLKYFAEKSGSTVLFYLHEFAQIVIFLYCLSYADQWYLNLFSFLEDKRLAHLAQPRVQYRYRDLAVPGINRGAFDHRRRDLSRANLRLGRAFRAASAAQILDQRSNSRRLSRSSAGAADKTDAR